MKRFRPELYMGSSNLNPEPLCRDDNGDFCLAKDVEKLIKSATDVVKMFPDMSDDNSGRMGFSDDAIRKVTALKQALNL